MAPTHSSTSSRSSKQKKKLKVPCWNPSDFPFPVDYNDCFETPLKAYQDVQPLIEWLAAAAAAAAAAGGEDKSKQAQDNINEICLYDPYYCNGRTAVLLREHLGYPNVVHEKRDFYAAIRNDTVPPYDILITNPPYSDTHKTKCLDYCFQQLRSNNRPFLLLMPAYTASKQYFRSFLKDSQDDEEVIYIIPDHDYHYDHPENTGKEESPFTSLWFCGIGRERARALRNSPPSWPQQLAFSVSDLDSQKVVSLQNRPNPRQRRKRRRKMELGEEDGQAAIKGTASLELSTNRTESETSFRADECPPSQTKRSKYRDQSGKRTKKRF